MPPSTEPIAISRRPQQQPSAAASGSSTGEGVAGRDGDPPSYDAAGGRELGEASGWADGADLLDLESPSPSSASPPLESYLPPSPRLLGPVTSARSIRTAGWSPRAPLGRPQRSHLQYSTSPQLVAQSARHPQPVPVERARYLHSSSPALVVSPGQPLGQKSDNVGSLQVTPFSLAGDVTSHTPLLATPHLARSASTGASVHSTSDRVLPLSKETPSVDAKQHSSDSTSLASRDIVFGLILASMEIPCMIGYAQIIFKDSFFAEDMHTLLKLVLFSCMVHQLSFMMASRLPFAIGSVQDAGLIFLSTMSSTIVQNCHTTERDGSSKLLPGLTRDDVVVTTVSTLAMSTLLLGVALALTGYFRLTNLVQYLPMPVVGGYLAYIGQFCLEAAVGLMSTRSIAVDCVPLYESIMQDDCGWTKVWTGHDPMIIAVGVILGLCLMQLQHKATHVAIFPAAMAAIIGIFYAVIWTQHGAIGPAVAAAREWGWLKKPVTLGDDGSGSSAEDGTASSVFSAWELFFHGKIQWSAVVKCAPSWLAMYFVVAFSSCLDIAAIQMEIGKVLDFDHEIQTVGLANVLSGATGGFTGSYIFTETVFAMRNGVRSNWCGATIICCLMACFCLPISLVTIVPSFFFGSVLSYIAAELLKEWLIDSRDTCSKSEYGVVWVSFLAINAFGVEIGMLTGILAQILAFVIIYARSGNLLTQRYWHSNVIRGFKQRSLSSKLHKDIVTLELHGFVFFGSAVRILEAVKRCCYLHAASDIAKDSSDSPSQNTGQAVKFLVLDFYHVTGLDTTGAATCFLTLRQRAEELGMTLIFCHVKPHVRYLLAIQKVLPMEIDAQPNQFVKEFATADEGLEWCESQLLQQISSLPPTTHAPVNSGDSSGVAEVLSAFLTQYMLPDSVAGGVMAQDIAINQGPGSQNPFGPPPRAIDKIRRLATENDTVHSLGIRHRNIPSKRALSKMLVEANDLVRDETEHGEIDESIEGTSTSRRSGNVARRPSLSSGSLNSAQEIGQFFEAVVVQEGDVVYEKSQLADCMYVLERGACEVVKGTQRAPGIHQQQRAGPLEPKRKLGGRRPDRGKLLRYEAGTVFGEVEFFLRHKRYFTIQAVEPNTVVHKLDWHNFDRLQLQKPQLACAFHTALMRWACRWVAVDINDGRRHHGADRFLQDVDGEDS